MTQEKLTHNLFKNLVTSLALVLALGGFTQVAHATYAIPSTRAISWMGNAGVQGEIPVRSTIYTTLKPSGGDDAAAIKSAIANCPAGQVVQLSAGTFNVSSPIVVKSNVTLRGNGMGSTIIKGRSGMSGTSVVGIGSRPTVGSAIALTGGLNKGSTTITTATAHGWTPGTIIVIDQLNNVNDDPPVTNVGNNGTCSWCGRLSGTRSLGQTAKVVAVPSPTTATLEIPLYWSYDTSLSPQGVKLSGVTIQAGIEKLTVDNSLSGSSAQKSSGTLLLLGTSNCWVQDTEVIGAYEAILLLNYGAYRNTIRANKLHEGFPTTAGDGTTSYATSRAYGINSQMYSSANLIENNQIYHLSTGLITAGPFSGNVFAYNYITSLYLNVLNFNPYAISFHGSHAFMNLIEGNYIDSRVASDWVWGTKSHNTFFRNKIALAPNRTGGAWDIDLQVNSRYYNIIGNVLGRSTESLYTLEAQDAKTSAIYRLGYNNDGDGSATGNDINVANSVVRHGNWDTYSNAVTWNRSDDQTLPLSLYLTGKPTWWGGLQWPCIGPDVSPKYPAAPGAGKGTPWANGSVKVVSSPSLTSVK
ncbi:glycosyl hydrolase family 28-related protein [Citrifermentans bremense]|uniref:glycosyl hydrolase family 28-related protein n=1 Tax=Citrifermentans bremense TaxID=60035 RepID=UPI0003F8342C|nr:glycosyl hydrolase family 28-related protein [Citrifermentans bremense]